MDSEDEILSRLAEISRLIESHRTAVWLLKRERSELLPKLPATGWKPPDGAQSQ
jgi:hypothetical protein